MNPMVRVCIIQIIDRDKNTIDHPLYTYHTNPLYTYHTNSTMNPMVRVCIIQIIDRDKNTIDHPLCTYHTNPLYTYHTNSTARVSPLYTRLNYTEDYAIDAII